MPDSQVRAESLGPAEHIIQSLTQYTDHLVHNRPGIVFDDPASNIRVKWQQGTWLKDGESRVAYSVAKTGKKATRTRVGAIDSATQLIAGTRARWQPPGLFPEVAVHLYQKIAEVWKMDNEFAAKWASFAFNHEESRDLKTLLAAFMLVQSRCGAPVDNGAFHDDDYRAVGEAMCLIGGKSSFNPKLLLRIGAILELPDIAEINRKLGFGRSTRNPFMGRYYKVVEKWLEHIELNPKLLDNFIRGGFKSSIMQLARKVGYKPKGPAFFEKLRWKQIQSKEGHRTIAIGSAIRPAESWNDLSEAEICQRIVSEKPSFKVIAGRLPASIGLTPAIMAAAIESGVLSDQDIIILTPTLEALGLLEQPGIATRWKAATERAETQRAANIAWNVRSQIAKEGLEKAVDVAAVKAIAPVTRGMRIYVMVDKSGSMHTSLEKAKKYVTKFVGAFPLDKLHVSVFNTEGREVHIKASTQAAVEHAFRGYASGGGTLYSEGLRCLLVAHPPSPDEDAFYIFVGDQEENNHDRLVHFMQSAPLPIGIGMLHVSTSGMNPNNGVVGKAARHLGIPFMLIDEHIFDDPYAVPRTIRNLIASAPVVQSATATRPKRVSLVEQILNAPLLQKPVWA